MSIDPRRRSNFLLVAEPVIMIMVISNHCDQGGEMPAIAKMELMNRADHNGTSEAIA
ncbi:hypothetical protein [Sphingosinicella humi]|uniref:hypothetical protein n=1 Tax=Allosphingosinicella humi TaxID=2068657 RepID=UPI0013049478|nr:hypothetical protein [Sphingosinicella humi]